MRDYEELDALQENAYLKDRVKELEIEVENLDLENFELKERIEELEEGKKDLPLEREVVLFCAFRYALGRMTYVVGFVCSELKAHYNILPSSFKESTAREIQEHQDTYGMAGMDFDNDEWNKVKWLFDESRHEEIEANKHNTDEWVRVVAVRGEDGKYYSIPEMKEYHTVRKVEL